MHKIVVLLHKNDTGFVSDPPNYTIGLLMREWRAMGFDVEVIRGVEHFVPADVLIPHLDLTVTPPEYRDFMLQYPMVVNGRVLDTSKSKISANLLGKNDSYTGPVIVKTDRNYGGKPESYLLPATPPLSARIIRKISSRLWPGFNRPISWKHVECLDTGNYPVFPCLRDVPNGVFKNHRLVVEKFLPEMEGDNYCLRYCYFFGDHEVNIVLKSKAKAVKYANAFQQEETPAPVELRSIRQRLGCDYGKLDYVLRDDKVVLFDVNRTPSSGRAVIIKDKAHQLAEGIWSKLNQSRV